MSANDFTVAQSWVAVENGDNAVVLRFVETEGKETECEAELFFQAKRAMYITNDERELEEISSRNNIVRFKCLPYSYTALKVFGSF